jgi:hypothetical protein
VAAFHGHEIESFEEASAFVDRLDHWQMARQALHYAVVSKASEDLAWREFRRGLAWLIDSGLLRSDGRSG